MECVFKPGQVYKTQDGREMLIYCNDAPGDFPIHGRIGQAVAARTAGGSVRTDGAGSPGDLMPPAPPRIREKVYMNTYRNGRGQTLWPTAEQAARFACRDGDALRIVPCMLIEIVDGEPGE